MPEAETSDLFLTVMRNVAATVTVVTATHDGKHYGLTVSAFSSVSLDPPLVLVCIDKRSSSFAAIKGAGGFTVNFLAADAEDTAMHFASKTEDKFASVAHRSPSMQVAGPWLAEAAFAYFECENVDIIDAGDHDVFVGRVHHGARINLEPPLMYWNGAFPKFARPDQVVSG
ncbi:MAG TPA: flavin reductase [Actinobacteria bacterium]|nr:flavin reductase [Actinomycetota bacterium]